MTSKRFKAIAQTMEAHGIVRVEMDGLVLVRERSKPSVVQSETKPIIDPNAKHTPSSPIQHKVEQVSSLLKMGDQDLVNALFPDHREEEV